MAGAIDDDTAESLASGRETAGAMLAAAQSNLKRVFLVFLLGLLGTFFALRWFVWDMFKRDLLYAQMDEATREATTVVATTPFEVVLLQVKIGLIVGIVTAIPALIWYSRKGLKRRGYWPSDRLPRWKVAVLVGFVGLLFVGGVFYAYAIFFPVMFAFLADNAVQAGLEPTYSIAKWTEFIFFLTLSFGLAAQLPLGMSGTALSGTVRYETFRDKWRYAVLGIFVFGAMFSPPDPFTQTMWAVPLVTLYGFSLGLTKLLVVSRRAGRAVPLGRVLRDHWNVLAGVFVLAGGAVYAFLTRGGLAAANDLLRSVGSSYRLPTAADLGAFGLGPTTVAVALAAGAGLLVTLVAVFYFRVKALEREVVSQRPGVTPEAATTAPETVASVGDPADIDIDALDAPGVRAAPLEAFADLTEERALQHAERALENEDTAKAEAILNRFDETQALDDGTVAEAEPDEADSSNPITSTAAGMADAFTDDETTEDDIGGYYYDIAFIVDSLTSKAIWLVGTFIVVLALSFVYLYTGGIGEIKNSFLGSMPESLAAQVDVVALHPVEALIFEIKFSTLLAAVAVLPLAAYMAWPAIEERGFASGTGNRNVLLVWGGTVVVTLIGGSLLGFFYIAPAIISALALDGLTSNMIIAYRINNFGWLVIFTTVGIGLFSEVPVTMWLFDRGGIISYGTMRRYWRVVVFAFFAAAGLVLPGGVFLMFIFAIPAVIAFGIGLLTLSAFHRVFG